MSVLSENRLSLSQLAKREGVNLCTCWRWALKGVKGVKLESLAVGGRRVTSHEAFERFISAINSTGDGSPTTPPPATPAQRKKQIAAAQAELKKFGI